MTKPVINTLSELTTLLVQQYERYLPTAFDESMTLLQKMNFVIERMNQVGEITNAVVVQWNAVMVWIENEGLLESVSTKLDELIADGTFDDIINQTIFTDLNNKINLLTDDYTINLYVSTSGIDTNDGLTALTPFKTVQKAFDTVKANAHRMNKGTWTINLAGGTYTEKNPMLTTRSTNRIIIQGQDVGGHPNLPVTIFNGIGGGNYEHGMTVSGFGVGATVKNIKFVNYNGDPSGNSRGGLLFDNGADGYTENVHVSDCSWFGVYYSRRSQGRQVGGIIERCRNGVLTDGSKCSVGWTATNLSQGTIIRNCTESGVYWSRGTDGHVDFCTLEANGIGIHIDTNSRVDAVGNTFKRNTIGVRTTNSGFLTDNPYNNNVFNDGTADANTQNYDFKAFSGEATEGMDITSPIRIAYDRTYRTKTGTGVTVLTTPYTIKKGRLKGVGKSCRVVSYGTYSVTNGSTITVKFGDMALTLTTPLEAATNAMFMIDVTLHEIQGGYRSFGSIRHNLSGERMGSTGTGFVVDSDQAISIECSLADAADTIGIYRTDIFMIG